MSDSRLLQQRVRDADIVNVAGQRLLRVWLQRVLLWLIAKIQLWSIDSGTIAPMRLRLNLRSAAVIVRTPDPTVLPYSSPPRYGSARCGSTLPARLRPVSRSCQTDPADAVIFVSPCRNRVDMLAGIPVDDYLLPA